MKYFLLSVLILGSTIHTHKLHAEKEQQELTTPCNQSEQIDHKNELVPAQTAQNVADIQDEFDELDNYFQTHPSQHQEPSWLDNEVIRDLIGRILAIPGAVPLLIKLASLYNWAHESLRAKNESADSNNSATAEAPENQELEKTLEEPKNL